MPCITGITSSDEARHYETLLCHACKHLTVDQIKNLKNNGAGIFDGIDWYSAHLWEDYYECKRTEPSAFGDKACLKKGLDALHHMTREEYDNRLEEIKSELKRIGYKIIDDETGYILQEI